MDGSYNVMNVFKAFGAKTISKPNVRITKIGCAEGHFPKVPIGQVVEGTFTDEVNVGESFNIKNATIIEGGNLSIKNMKGGKYKLWCTSIIQEILSNNTFQTKNSIYKWETIK